uniref:Chromosome 5 C1orf56 homolog n=1 Tax=Equus caballus TaxID=9796 RepID=A0A9L0SGN9_HORSE
MRDLSSGSEKVNCSSPTLCITSRLWVRHGFLRRGSLGFQLSPWAAGAPARRGPGGGARRARPSPQRASVQTTWWVERGREGEKAGAPASLTGLPPNPTPPSPMVPAAGALLWALLLSLGLQAAGAQGLTSTGMQRVSFRFGGPMTRSYRTTARTGAPRKMRVTVEDEDDLVAEADHLAGPAAAELLASTVYTGISQSRLSQEEDGSLEEGVVIDAGKSNTRSGIPSMDSTTRGSSSRFTANSQEPEIRLTSSPPPSTWRSSMDLPPSGSTLNQWSTAGATPNAWPPPSATAMPPPEDLRVVLMPWGPWHCHCKSGTMSRTRAGKLHGLSGRLRVGALSQLRTEHRPCTYQQCPCNRHREECPLDSGLCPDTSCTTQTTTTTTASMPPLSARLRPTPFPMSSPSPALDFWKRVRMGLEDIWNSLSSVFTEMQPRETRGNGHFICKRRCRRLNLFSHFNPSTHWIFLVQKKKPRKNSCLVLCLFTEVCDEG